MRALHLARVSIGVWTVTVWNAALGLITTPFMIHHLGPARYGIFALITIIATYLSNLEIGFGQATLRFLARARAAGEADQEEHVLGTSFAVFLVAGSTATLLALGASHYITDHFVHGDARGEDALTAIRVGALTLFASLIGSFAAVALQAIGQFRLTISARFVFGTLMSAGSVTTVALGGGLVAVLLVLLVINVLQAGALFVGLIRSTAVSILPRIHRPTFFAMAKFGLSILAAGLAFQVLLQGPPTVLAGYTTTDQVAAYAVPSTIMQQIVVFMGSASFAFAPFASAESVSSDRTRLAAIFGANVRLTLLFAGPVAGYLALFSHELLTAWIGSSFAHNATGPLRFLGIAALLLAVSAAPADVLRGLGHPTWVAWYTGGTAAITLAASFALVHSHGASGVALALAIGLTIGTLVLLVIVADKLLAISPRQLGVTLLKPVLAVGVATSLFAASAVLTSGFVAAIATGVIVAAVYLAAAIRWVLEERERTVVASLHPRFRRSAGRAA